MRELYASQPAAGWLPWGALAPLLALLFVALPSIGASLLMEHFGLADTRGHPIGVPGLLALLLVPFPLIALVVLGWVRCVERRPLATIGLVGADGMRRFLRGHAVGLATLSMVVLAIWLAGGSRAEGYAQALASPGALAGVALLLFGFALQSGVEEIVFRGWLLSALARKLHLALAVLLTSAVFALLHYKHYNSEQPVLSLAGTSVFSLFTCCWALKAGSIWGVMGWHSGWNWLLATGFELPLSGLGAIEPALLVKLVAQGPAYLTGGAHGPEASVVCMLFFVGASAWLVRRARPRRAPIDAGP